MHNIASAPAYAGEVKRLDTMLVQELKASRDPRIEGQGDVFDNYPARLGR